MTKLVLVTGFLGAGKTTLVKRILDTFSDSKIGVIINEFGEINIDATLIKRDGVKMAELSNGSIFCACIKENFIASLIEMSKMNLEYLFIEASGLADPASMPQILSAIKSKTEDNYFYKGAICIIDPETFVDLSEILPALSNQVEYSSVGIINKSDIVSEDVIKEVEEKVCELNEQIALIITSYCDIDIRETVNGLTASVKEGKESTNTFESRPKTFILKGDVILNYEKLDEFLNCISKSAFRIKGFAITDKGNFEISCVGKHVSLLQWKEELRRTEIVAISSVGIKLLSLITAKSAEILEGGLHL